MNKHEIRSALVSNGYRPVPLVDKGPRIKGWTSAEIDEDWLAQYARCGNMPGTGIRCDDLLAFDVDVLDEDLALQAEDIIADEVGPSELCRFGRYPKRLLLYRVEGPPPDRSRRTAKYGGHMVELLAGRGRQFAAFAIHPGTGEPYEWDRESPLQVAYADLPAITVDQAHEAMDALELWLEGTGLERTGRGYTAGHMPEVEDLLPGTELEAGGELTTWADLRDDLTAAGVFGNLMREDGIMGDSGGVHFYLAPDGDPVAYDFPRDVLHREVAPGVGVQLPPQTGGSQFDDPALADMLAGYVLLRDGTVRDISNPLQPIKLTGFRDYWAHVEVQDPLPPQSNPGKQVPLVDAWKKDARVLRADRVELRPDHAGPPHIFADGDSLVLNAYRPPIHPPGRGELGPVLAFVEHLIPDETERGIFLDWIATKVVKPELRLHGLMTVTQTFGTGRGTWSEIVSALLGRRYVREVALRELLGSGSQAQFNDYLADSLVVHVSEALDEDSEDGGHSWKARRGAYDRLKQLIDTTGAQVRIKRKYGTIDHVDCFASTLIDTNHLDALVIPPEDRRLIVLSAATTPLVQVGTLRDDIHHWRRQPANIAAFWHWLAERGAVCQYDPMGHPPNTIAKSRMAELSSMSDPDIIAQTIAADAAGDLMTYQQFERAALALVRTSLDLALPDEPTRLKRQLVAVLRSRARRPAALPPSGIKVGGAVVRPWILRNFEHWEASDDRAGMRGELVKNGEIGGGVLPFKR